MINKNGLVLVADFGIARMTETATTTTMLGAGTPAYMAPEQARGEAPTPQSDIYALGIVLYELLTGGERPFTGEQASITGTTAEKLRWEHINLKAPSLRKYSKNIPPEVDAVIQRCLEKDPALRYKSAIDLWTELQRVLVERASGQPLANPQPAVTLPKKPEQQPATAAITNGQRSSTPKSSPDSNDPVKQSGRKPWIQLPIILGGIILLLVGFIFGSNGSGFFKPAFTPSPTITKTSNSTSTRVPAYTPTPEFTPTAVGTMTRIPLASTTTVPTRIISPSLSPTRIVSPSLIPTRTRTPYPTAIPEYEIKVTNYLNWDQNLFIDEIYYMTIPPLKYNIITIKAGTYSFQYCSDDTMLHCGDPFTETVDQDIEWSITRSN
jgi:serine/threonine-protein kinase